MSTALALPAMAAPRGQTVGVRAVARGCIAAPLALRAAASHPIFLPPPAPVPAALAPIPQNDAFLILPAATPTPDAPSASERLEAIDAQAPRPEAGVPAARAKAQADRLWDALAPRGEAPAVSAPARRVAALTARLGPAPAKPYRTPRRLAVPLALTRAGQVAADSLESLVGFNLVASAVVPLLMASVFIVSRLSSAGLLSGRREAPRQDAPQPSALSAPSAPTGATAAQAEESRLLFAALLARAGGPHPRAPVSFVINDATGKRNAYFVDSPMGPGFVALGSETAALDLDARAGVIAHELGHYALDRLMAPRLTARLAASVQIAAAVLSSFLGSMLGLMMIVATFTAWMGRVEIDLWTLVWLNFAAFGLQIAFSLASSLLKRARYRLGEYRADDYAAWLTRPQWLSKGLARITTDTEPVPGTSALSRLLITPLRRMLRTHPLAATRQRRLQEAARRRSRPQ